MKSVADPRGGHAAAPPFKPLYISKHIICCAETVNKFVCQENY